MTVLVSRNKVFPEEEISLPWKNEEEQTPEKKHEPMFINPSYQGSRREGLTTWSPYRAADEVTLISMPKTVVPEDDMERKSHHSKRPAVNLPEPVPKASYTTEPQTNHIEELHHRKVLLIQTLVRPQTLPSKWVRFS
nr:uncharacterized protein LOC117690133 [Crassostrea gigas]